MRLFGVFFFFFYWDFLRASKRCRMTKERRRSWISLLLKSSPNTRALLRLLTVTFFLRIYIYLFFLICIYMLRFFFFWWGFVGLGLFTGFLFDGKMEKGGQEKVLKFKILCSLYHKVKLSGYIGFSSVMFQFDYFLIHSLHFLATKQSFVFLLGTGVMYLVMTRLISENK